MFIPIKKKRGEKCLDAAEKLYSTAGLMVHIFGRLAAAIFFWSFLRISS